MSLFIGGEYKKTEGLYQVVLQYIPGCAPNPVGAGANLNTQDT